MPEDHANPRKSVYDMTPEEVREEFDRQIIEARRREKADESKLMRALGSVGFTGAVLWALAEVFNIEWAKGIGELLMFYGAWLFVPIVPFAICALPLFLPTFLSWIWRSFRKRRGDSPPP